MSNIEGLISPSLGDSDYGGLDSNFSKSLEAIDSHTHGDGKGVPVKRVSISATDNSSIESSNGVLRLKDSGVTTVKFLDGSANQDKIAALPFTPNECNTDEPIKHGTNSYADLDIDDSVVGFNMGGVKTITLNNRPVLIIVNLKAYSTTALSTGNVRVLRNSTVIRNYRFTTSTSDPRVYDINDCFLDDGPSGSTTYKIQVMGPSFSFGQVEFAGTAVNPGVYNIFSNQPSFAASDALTVIEL